MVLLNPMFTVVEMVLVMERQLFACFLHRALLSFGMHYYTGAATTATLLT